MVTSFWRKSWAAFERDELDSDHISLNIDFSRPQMVVGAMGAEGESWLWDRDIDGESIELDRVSE